MIAFLSLQSISGIIYSSNFKITRTKSYAKKKKPTKTKPNYNVKLNFG